MKRITKKGWIFYVSLLAAMAAMALAPQTLAIGACNLENAQVKAAAILIFALVNWIMETVPVAVTSLMVIAMLPFSGIMTFAEAIRGSFGNSLFGFFLGTLILSAAFSETNLGRLIAAGLSAVFGKTPRALVLAVMLSGLFLAMWVTEVAAAAIIFPIALAIVDQVADTEKRGWFGKAMMLAVAWGCAFGGVATPIATGSNLIALNYLEQYCGIRVTFVRWMIIGIPISLTLTAVGWLILATLVKDNHVLQIKEEKIPMGGPEKKLAVVFFLAVLLWVFGGMISLESYHVALMAGIVLFMPGINILSWKKTMNSISWDSIMLICSGVLIGDLLYQCGLAKMAADLFFIPGLLKQGVFLSSVYIVLTVSLLKIMFSSNTVTGIVLVPIMIMLAEKVHMPPWQMAAPCIFSSALSLVIITSSPVNVIPYSARYFTPVDMLKYGIPMTLASAGVIGAWLWIFRM